MAAAGAPVRVPAAVACEVLGFSRQGYYQWLKDPVTQRDWDDAHLIDAALEAHGEDPGYGYRFIADELAEKGFKASENRVWRLCSAQGIFSTHSKKRGLNRKPGPPVHDDLLAIADNHGRPTRDFTAEEPNTKRLTDIPPNTSCREVPPPSIRPARASCICARSRTAARERSWATRSTHG